MVSINTQTPISFSDDVDLEKLIHLIDEHSKMPPLVAAPNSYLQALLQSAKLESALYVSIESAQKIFEQISKRSWDMNHFKAFGMDINRWLQDLQEEINGRENFLRKIEINKADKKIAQLASSELK